MDQDITEAQNVMKEIFVDEVKTAFEQAVVLIHMFPPGGFVHARGAEWTVYLEPNPDVRAYVDGGKLPPGSSTVSRKHKVTYGRVAISRVVTDDVLVTDRLNIVQGMQYHINDDSGIYQNLSRSTFSRQLVPTVKDMQNADLSPAELDLTEELITIKKGTDYSIDDLIYLSASSHRRAYRKQGYNTDVKVVKQWSGMDKVFDQGWKTIQRNGRTWVIDNDAPPDELYMPTRSSFKKYTAKPVGLLNTAGRHLREIPAFDSNGQGTFRAAYQYTINTLYEIANEDILANGRMKKLNIDGLPLKFAA